MLNSSWSDWPCLSQLEAGRRTAGQLVMGLLISFFPAGVQSLIASETVGGIVINEIHFNPGKLTGESQREKREEEFIELFNAGDEPVNLDGWQFSRGVDFTFSSVTMPSGGFLVVAADLDAFRRNHPTVEDVVGPYSGNLSNTSEDIELEDAVGKRIDLVEYADSGHWARLKTTKLKSYDHWEWEAFHDGEGMSLELTNPLADNFEPLAWGASSTVGGTPGNVNSNVDLSNFGPWIGKIEHSPAVPTSAQTIAITAKIGGKVESARVLYRPDGFSGPFSSSVLERSSGRESTWTGEIPPHSNGSIVEYLIEATGENGIRHWPGLSRLNGKDPARNPVPLRQALYLFQVDDSFDETPIVNGEQTPAYRLIIPRRELSLMRTIAGRSSNNSVYNNRFVGTFISIDPAGTRVRHLCTSRIRGNGSRSKFPPGIRVSFPSDDPWKGVQDINLNSQHTHSQVLGAAIHQVMGFPAARATAVTLTMNGEDWTRPGLPQFGHYTCNEVLDGDYIDRHFPTESIGNLYRGVGQANLNDRGDRVSSYRTYYRKRNNASKDDYSDVIQLCKVLDRENDTSVSDEQYLNEVKQIVDVDQWMRYFALDALLCNLEGGFPSGRGDDYAMFRGSDGRFRLVPYDLDSILGRGDPGEELTKSIFAYGNTRGLRRLFKHPEVTRIYFGHIRTFLETSFRPDVLNRIVDDVLGSWVHESEIEEIKAFIPRRIAAVKSQIDGYTVAGSTLEYAGGYHRTERPDFLLYGRFDPAEVLAVAVNGRSPDQIDLRAGTWLMKSTRENPLVSPGITPVIVQLQGAGGEVVDSATIQVWYDTGATTKVSGRLAEGKTVWDAESGPFYVTGELVVPVGAELRITEGTTVFFAEEAGLKVSGNLEATGTVTHPVRFSSPVSDQGNVFWKGIRFANDAQTSRLSHVAIAGVKSPDGTLKATGGTLNLQDVRFGRTEGPVIVAQDLALTLSRCEFVEAEGFVIQNGGTLSIEACEFGHANGDWAIDVRNTNPGTTIGIRKNRFSSGGKLGAVRIGNHSVILENLFGVGRAGASSAVIVSETCEVVVAGNGYLGWEQAVLLEKGGSGLFEGNTCRFSAESVLGGDTDRIEVSNNLIVPVGKAGPFLHADSAWTARGRPADWSLLQRENAPTDQSAHSQLLSVIGVPPSGKGAPGERRITFRYPGAASFLASGKGVKLPAVQKAENFSATFSGDGSEPISLIVTLLSGEQLEIPEAASWIPVEGHTNIAINEVVAADSDAVELYNYGLTAFDLGGFRLTDNREKPDKFVFPEGAIIRPGDYLVVSLGKTAGFSLAKEGEEVALFEPKSTGSDGLIDSIKFGNQIRGFSIGRIGAGWGLCEPSLGAKNVPARVSGPRMVRLAEWLAARGGAIEQDFVELRNPSIYPADISGCGLTDQISTSPFRHHFPPLSFLPADSVEAFFAKEKKSGEGTLEFQLSEDGEVLGFLDSNGATIDWAIFQPQASGRSQGRDDSGRLVMFTLPTPGQRVGVDVSHQQLEIAGALRISEVHYHPHDDGDAEFLELANMGESKIDLSGVRLSGGIEFLFQDGHELRPGERAVIVRDRRIFREIYGDGVPFIGEYSGKLANGGERLKLVSADGTAIQQFKFSDKWYPESDGGGSSLEAVFSTESNRDWSESDAWRPSSKDGGTPGQ